MRRALVKDVMTRDVVTFLPDTPFHEITRTLAERGISGAPVLGANGSVIGVVSETDVLRKEEFKASSDQRPRFESHERREARERAKGRTAEEIMNKPAICVPQDATVAEAVRLMTQHGVKRLPVVTGDGALAGIVTRGDLMRVFLRSDEEIRDEVVNEVLRRYLWQDVKLVEVDVNDGVVTLRGTFDVRSLVPIAERLTGSVEGVIGVVNELSYEQDDTTAEARRYRR